MSYLEQPVVAATAAIYVQSMNHVSVKSPTAQDAFRPIPGLISCAGVTRRWGLLSHAQNAVGWLALSKGSVDAFYQSKYCTLGPWAYSPLQNMGTQPKFRRLLPSRGNPKLPRHRSGVQASTFQQQQLELHVTFLDTVVHVELLGEDIFRSAFQSSNPIGQYIIHDHMRTCASALTVEHPKLTLTQP